MKLVIQSNPVESGFGNASIVSPRFGSGYRFHFNFRIPIQVSTYNRFGIADYQALAVSNRNINDANSNVSKLTLLLTADLNYLTFKSVGNNFHAS